MVDLNQSHRMIVDLFICPRRLWRLLVEASLLSATAFRASFLDEALHRVIINTKLWSYRVQRGSPEPF